MRSMRDGQTDSGRVDVCRYGFYVTFDGKCEGWEAGALVEPLWRDARFARGIDDGNKPPNDDEHPMSCATFVVQLYARYTDCVHAVLSQTFPTVF